MARRTKITPVEIKDGVEYYECTLTEANVLIRRSGGRRSYFVAGGTFLRTPRREGDEPTTIRGFDVNCSIRVPGRRYALQYVKDMLRPAYEVKGARLRISVHPPRDGDHYRITHLFIG